MDGTSKERFVLFLPKLVGQATTSNNLKPANRKMIAWNIIYMVIYLSIFVWTLYTTRYKEDKYGYKGYSFISQIKYCVHLYGTSGFLFFINTRVTYYRNDIRHVYKRLSEMLVDFKNLGISRRHQEFDYVSFTLTALVLSTAVALVTDTIRTPRSIPLCLWICLYAPGFSCVVYVCVYVAMFSGCANSFFIINRTLEGYAYPELSCSQIYSLRKAHIRPYPLLKTLPKKSLNMLDQIFLLHDETCELTRLLNSTCGVEFLVYFGLTSATVISLGYTFALDLIALSHGDPISETNTRACDFWGAINIFGLLAITVVAANVKENCENTTRLIHRLINIYADLDQFGDIYALQMSHQTATVTAVGFFTVDKTIVLGLLSAWATYLIILIQFSE